MKVFFVLLFCLFSAAAHSKEDIIETMARVVCDCRKENEKQPGVLVYTSCVIEQLEPKKHSIKKLIKKIIRKDNKGEDLDELDAFNEAFEKAINKNCPGKSFDYSDIFNELLK